MTQRAIFPMKYINITQKWGGGTHTYGYPIDNAGKDTRIDEVFAPFDGVIKKIYKNGNTVWLESLEPVEFANGVKDYAVVSFTHDDDVSDLEVGQVVRQGQVFYAEGTAGQATGNHVHIECGRGKFKGSGWYQAQNGQWVINDPVKPPDMFVATKDNVVINSMSINFSKEEDMPTIKNKEEARLIYVAVLHRDGSKVEDKDLQGLVGQDIFKVMDKMRSSGSDGAEWHQANDILGRAYPAALKTIDALKAQADAKPDNTTDAEKKLVRIESIIHEAGAA